MKKVAIVLIALLMCLAMSSLVIAAAPSTAQENATTKVDAVASATPSYYRVFTESYLKTLPLDGGYYFCQKSSSPYSNFSQDWYGLNLANLLDQEVGLADDATTVTLYAKDFATNPNAYVELDLNARVRNPNADGKPSILAWKKYSTTNVDLNDPMSPLLSILDSTSEGPFRLALGQYPNVGPYNPTTTPPLTGSPNYNLFLKMVRAIKVGPVSGVPDVDVTTIPDNEIVVYGDIHPWGITSITPASGPVGTEVTISGYGFRSSQGTSTVSFGAIPATDITSWGPKQIKCKVPAGVTGTVDVTVTTAEGTSNAVSFTEANVAPTVTSINPTFGVQGWSVVNITDLEGTGFKAGASVSLVKGSTVINATDVNVVSDTKITCNFSLASNPDFGKYDVVVTNPDTLAGTLTQGFSVTNACGGGATISVAAVGLVMGLLSIAGIGGITRRRKRSKK